MEVDTARKRAAPMFLTIWTERGEGVTWPEAAA